jgi:hypothetical protein
VTDVVDQISWERVELPVGSVVRPFDAVLVDGQANNTYNISFLADLDLTTVFAGSQSTSGQALGETNYGADDILGVAAASFKMSSQTDVLFKRDGTTGNSTWSAYAVQWAP